MYKLGIVGLGEISKYYLEAIKHSKKFKLVAACDSNPSKMDRVSRDVPFYTNYQSLLNSCPLDCVILNLPNHLHYLACKEFLRHRIHVCCEKPLVIKTSDAVELCAASKELKTILFTAFHRRYNRHIIDLKAKLATYEKPVKMVTISYKEKIEEHCGKDSWYLDPLHCGGGCIADNGPNTIDTLLFLFGDLQIQNAIINSIKSGVEYSATISGKLQKGVPVEILLDWDYQMGEDKAVQLLFEDDMVKCDMLAGYPIFKSSLYHEYEGVLADFANFVDNAPKSSEIPSYGLAVSNYIGDIYRLQNVQRESNYHRVWSLRKEVLQSFSVLKNYLPLLVRFGWRS